MSMCSKVGALLLKPDERRGRGREEAISQCKYPVSGPKETGNKWLTVVLISV